MGESTPGSRTEIPKNFTEPALFQMQRTDAKQIPFARVDHVDTHYRISQTSFCGIDRNRQPSFVIATTSS